MFYLFNHGIEIEFLNHKNKKINTMATNYAKLKKLKEEAENAYFNSGSPIMTDDAYDGLCLQLEKMGVTEPNESVGCLPPSDFQKISLPIYMGSLTKHNDNDKLNIFLAKFNHKTFVVQEKLDGVSCLAVYGGRDQIKLYTRGNGTVGTDITHLIKYGLNLPSSTQSTVFMVRGELVISKNKFKAKYNESFKNIRNMVSGQLSKKIPNKSIVADIDFITYEVIQPIQIQPSAVDQYHVLKKNNFKVVHNHLIERQLINQEFLMDYLNRRKRKSDYDIDGLVITINGEYERSETADPKYSFAFKIQGETAEVQVDHVKWNLSKSGKFKPQIFIKPVELSGVTISSLTGFNAEYIVINKIVCGSILLITRSGDVIPHIITVLKNGDGEVNLPHNSKWKSVDLYHNFEKDPDEVVVKQMVHFFTSLKCLNCQDKTILKIYNAGYKTIEGVIEAQREDFSKIEGIGMTLATKILSSIQKNIKEASIHELLAALNSFGEGIGLKKIKNIDLNNPNNLKIKGLSEATIVEKILPLWKVSLDRVKNIKKLVGESGEIEPQSQDLKTDGFNPLEDQIFVFTGFRDALLEKQIFSFGGKVTSAISKKTTDLIIASEVGLQSTKQTKAKNLGIKISTKEQLIDNLKKLHDVINVKNEVDYDHYSSEEDE